MTWSVCWSGCVVAGLLPVFWTLLADRTERLTTTTTTDITAGYKRVDEVAKQALDSSGRVWGPSSSLGRLGIIIIYYLQLWRTGPGPGPGLGECKVSMCCSIMKLTSSQQSGCSPVLSSPLLSSPLGPVLGVGWPWSHWGGRVPGGSTVVLCTRNIQSG